MKNLSIDTNKKMDAAITAPYYTDDFVPVERNTASSKFQVAAWLGLGITYKITRIDTMVDGTERYIFLTDEYTDRDVAIMKSEVLFDNAITYL